MQTGAIPKLRRAKNWVHVAHAQRAYRAGCNIGVARTRCIWDDLENISVEPQLSGNADVTVQRRAGE
jgi:hypothetical protein